MTVALTLHMTCYLNKLNRLLKSLQHFAHVYYGTCVKHLKVLYRTESAVRPSWGQIVVKAQLGSCHVNARWSVGAAVWFQSTNNNKKQNKTHLVLLKRLKTWSQWPLWTEAACWRRWTAWTVCCQGKNRTKIHFKKCNEVRANIFFELIACHLIIG